MNVAVTDFAVSIVTVHVPVPEHAPLQPVKVESDEELAVNVTMVLLLKADEQVLPQLIPVGLLVTVPLPVPAFVTVKVLVGIAFTVRVNELTLFASPDDAPVIDTDDEPTVALVVAEYVNVTVHIPDDIGVHD